MFNFSLLPGISTLLPNAEFNSILERQVDKNQLHEIFRKIFSFLDYTTLDGADTHTRVAGLCERAVKFAEQGLPYPAAVCIYAPFISTAKKVLSGSPVKVATTAAAFPSGQMALHIKLAEIEYAISEGADEIDVVISRGTFLEGSYDILMEELQAMRLHCGEKTLKVILETGELKTAENIAMASELAIRAGADFIKTSTGKVTPAATPEAVYIMLQVIREHFKKTGHRIGIKPAGGIADPATSMQYYRLVKDINGDDWLNSGLFRIGASRLADGLADLILKS